MKGLRGILSGALVVVLCCGLAASVLSADENILPDLNKQQHVIVRLHYIGGIDRPELTVEPGTTVVWINDSRDNVELAFTAKQVTRACKSPVHFVIDENGTFVSNRIPQGSVASLCFVEKGEFSYTMTRSVIGGGSSGVYRGAQKEFSGKITVQ
jgi:plastocyanin